MNFKEQLEMIDEENCSINNVVPRIYYISKAELRHFRLADPQRIVGRGRTGLQTCKTVQTRLSPTTKQAVRVFAV